MAKNWYPIIDYGKCTGCLACVKSCPHGVLKEENGKPLVANPDACVEFCRGCQKGACENDAITYFGDKGVKNG
ncbi:MAG: 4Fe-4S binding protein [Caldisericota bacterium]|nr:4Fe-4S binding protein [Caldisericota bacterium]